MDRFEVGIDLPHIGDDLAIIQAVLIETYMRLRVRVRVHLRVRARGLLGADGVEIRSLRQIPESLRGSVKVHGAEPAVDDHGKGPICLRLPQRRQERHQGVGRKRESFAIVVDPRVGLGRHRRQVSQRKEVVVVHEHGGRWVRGRPSSAVFGSLLSVLSAFLRLLVVLLLKHAELRASDLFHQHPDPDESGEGPHIAVLQSATQRLQRGRGMYTRTHICIHMHTRILTHVYIHLHIYIYIYVCLPFLYTCFIAACMHFRSC